MFCTCSLLCNCLFVTCVLNLGTSPRAQQVKNPPAIQETQVRSLGQKDPVEEEMATHSCLGNAMDRGAWWATVHGSQSQTRLSTHAHP